MESYLIPNRKELIRQYNDGELKEEYFLPFPLGGGIYLCKVWYFQVFGYVDSPYDDEKRFIRQKLYNSDKGQYFDSLMKFHLISFTPLHNNKPLK